MNDNWNIMQRKCCQFRQLQAPWMLLQSMWWSVRWHLFDTSQPERTTCPVMQKHTGMTAPLREPEPSCLYFISLYSYTVISVTHWAECWNSLQNLKSHGMYWYDHTFVFVLFVFLLCTPKHAHFKTFNFITYCNILSSLQMDQEGADRLKVMDRWRIMGTAGEVNPVALTKMRHFTRQESLGSLTTLDPENTTQP